MTSPLKPRTVVSCEKENNGVSNGCFSVTTIYKLLFCFESIVLLVYSLEKKPAHSSQKIQPITIDNTPIIVNPLSPSVEHKKLKIASLLLYNIRLHMDTANAIGSTGQPGSAPAPTPVHGRASLYLTHTIKASTTILLK